MKHTNKLTILLLVFALLSITPTWVYAAQVRKMDSGHISQELAKLEPYVKYVDFNGVKQQEFDAESAVMAGFSQEVILIAEDMIAFQNDLSAALSPQNNINTPQLFLPEDKYSYMKAYFSQATQHLQNQNITGESLFIVIDDVNPCGDWDHPVPNYTPDRIQYSSSTPSQALINAGFHITAGYACGQDPLVPCSNDYTRPRSYSGSYGTCDSPRFRDQGSTGTNNYKIQYGEPNPEVLSYSWPYWNWGAYVYWWHTNY